MARWLPILSGPCRGSGCLSGRRIRCGDSLVGSGVGRTGTVGGSLRAIALGQDLDPAPDVERDDGGGRVRDLTDHRGHPVGSPVVQQPAEQRGVAAPWHHRRNSHAWQLRLRLDQLGRGSREPPVRAVHEVEHYAGIGPQPVLSQPVGLGAVDDEMHRPQAGRAQAPRVPQGSQRCQVKLVHEDVDGAARIGGRRGGLGRTTVACADVLEHLGFHPVLPVQPDQRRHADREHDQDHPSALGELDHSEDEHDDQRGEPRGEVDGQLVVPAGLLVHVVILGHAEASQRERGENPDRVERDEPVDVGAGHG